MSCCKEVGLNIDDLKHISLGMALDVQVDYIALRNPDQQAQKTRKASQVDIDNF